MRAIKFITLLLGCFSFLHFTSCDKSSNHEEEILNSKIGVHKIEVDVESASELQHIAVFVGNQENGNIGSTLYNATGESQGREYLTDTNTTVSNKIICYTDGNSINLTMSYSLIGKPNDKATLVIKSYLNDKMISKINKNVIFTDKYATETVTISTIMQ